MSAFGTVILPSQIEDAVVGVLQAWMDTYLREIERRTNRTGGALPSIKPGSWGLASSPDQRFAEQQLPGAQVTWSDMALTRHADGLSSTIPFSVEVLVQAGDFNAVRLLASLYAFALVMIVDDKLRLSSLVSSVTTPQLSVPVVSGAERRWRAIATVDFSVLTDLVLDDATGPTEPFPDPTPVPPDTLTVADDGVVVEADLDLPQQ